MRQSTRTEYRECVICIWAEFYGQGIPSVGRAVASDAPFEVYVNDCSPVEEVWTDLCQRLA